MAEYLFVYGTLLKGESKNTLINGCALDRYCSVPGKLFDTGAGYPVAFYDSNMGTQIFGELYRLPEKGAVLLEMLDSYEDIPRNIYVRKIINLGDKKVFIYTAEDFNDLKNMRIIDTGSWLKHMANIKNDPVCFALNFEKAHRSYYRNSLSENIITLPGSSGIMISSPHATNHVRENKLKRFEVYTAALGTLMHLYADTNVVYTNSVSAIDPNYYDDCSYKINLKNISDREDLKFVLDLHGTGEDKEHDIYPGVGRNMEFLLGKDYILEDLHCSANEYGLTCGGIDIFPASKQKTVTRYCATNLGIPSMQLEINRKLRFPEKYPENFVGLFKFLVRFLGRIKKRNE